MRRKIDASSVFGLIKAEILGIYALYYLRVKKNVTIQVSKIQ